MKKLFNAIAIMVFAFVFTACDNNELLQSNHMDTENKEIKTRAGKILDNDSIIQLNEKDFPKHNTVKKRLMASDNIWQDLYQLNGIEFFIQSKDTYFGKNTIETYGKGKELKLSAYSPSNPAQLFYIKFLPPSTGIQYLIYSYKENVPIGVGQYSNNPRYVLYAKSSDQGSLFGFSWDFYAKDKSYFIENRDIISGGGSNPWDIYYHSITANNGVIDLLRTSKTANQEFSIIPNDIFTVNSFDIELESAQITKSEPVILKQFIVESASQPITKELVVEESKTEETNFQESSSTTIKHSGDLSVGLSLKVITSIGGKFSFEKSNTQAVSYAYKSSITRRISDKTAVTIPPNTKAIIDYQSIKHNLRVNYVIVFKGIRSSKLIQVKGVWDGVDYTTDHFIVNEYDREKMTLKATRVLLSTK